MYLIGPFFFKTKTAQYKTVQNKMTVHCGTNLQKVSCAILAITMYTTWLNIAHGCIKIWCVYDLLPYIYHKH